MIFGISVRRRTVRSVELVCPRCGLDRTGAEIVASRWASVLGVPIVPLGEHDPVITCDVCGHSSDLGVLDVPTTAQLSTLLREATVAALVLAVRTSEPDDRSAALAAATVALDDAGFSSILPTFDDAVHCLNDIEARVRVRRVGRELTPFGKQGFLHRVAAVGAASGADAARDALVQIGCDLGMAAPHINGVLAVADIAA
jgi:hypothetical protein